MRKHPTRSRRVLGSNPIWGTDFSEFPMASTHISFHIYMSGKICIKRDQGQNSVCRSNRHNEKLVNRNGNRHSVSGTGTA